MTARILVVDDIPANVKLLEARLAADYFHVLTATNGRDALAVCAEEQVDLVLLDIMMPGMDGFEVCERLKADPKTAHIPVVIVTALDGREDKLRGLAAGADDFLTKPVNDLQLMSRVRSLVRLKSLTDELRVRAATAEALGFQDAVLAEAPEDEPRGRVLLVDGRAQSRERIAGYLEPIADVVSADDPQRAVFAAAEDPCDLVIVSGSLPNYDPLRLCAQMRSLERTRFLPILLTADSGHDDVDRRALEIGVNDYIVRPIDANELLARVRTQIMRKRCNDRLRDSVRHTMELAVTDALTGLHNRHYLDMHLDVLVERARARGRPLSLCTIDIDSFKRINDTYGHEAGDDVLVAFARRLRGAVRGADLACRYGGEEFVVVMPDTPAETAIRIAERLRLAVEAEPFALRAARRTIPVTASFGIATLAGPSDTREELLRRSDHALYAAKRDGRNRVVSAAA
ncbi:MAG: PleD family two-component system response regulator [Pararhizobium sp.]